MSTKKNNACHEMAFDDEPMFTLLARDPAAPAAIMAWIDQSMKRGIQPEEKLREAFECAMQMRRQQSIFARRRNEQRMKPTSAQHRPEGMAAFQPDMKTEPVILPAQCDVAGCKNDATNGGCGWPDVGYWCLCTEHLDQWLRDKTKPIPEMKDESRAREWARRRDKEMDKMPGIDAARANARSEHARGKCDAMPYGATL